MKTLDIWTEPDNDEPEDHWIELDTPTSSIEIYVAAQDRSRHVPQEPRSQSPEES